jgi:hypothetical protein
VYILVIVLTVLLHTDYKIVQKSLLINEMGDLCWLCLIYDRNSWKASLNKVIFLDIL